MDITKAQMWRAQIKAFMAWYGINTAQWCARAGVSYSSLNGFLNGHSNSLRYETLDKLAESLGVTVAMIMGEVPRPGMNDSAKQGDFGGMPPELVRLTKRKKKALDKLESMSPTDQERALQMIDILSKTGKIEDDK